MAVAGPVVVARYLDTAIGLGYVAVDWLRQEAWP